jgi:parvulin-like peptidyl-prolyl isomerase
MSLASIDGVGLGIGELAQSIELRAGLQALVEQAIERRLVAAEIERRGLRVEALEVQGVVDAWRAERGLQRSEDTLQWLGARGLTPEALAAEGLWLARRACLRRELARGTEQYFAEHRTAFDSAVIERIEVKEEAVAGELAVELEEEEASFEELARRCSVDAETARRGGFVGTVHRGELPAALTPAVFGARAGQIVGPLQVDGRWVLVRVIAVEAAVLDALTRQQIEERLYRDWLSAARALVDVRWFL